MTPEEHQKEFIYQAQKLGLDVSKLSTEEIAKEFISAPLDVIQSLTYFGAPFSSSELIPEDWATMYHARNTTPNTWLTSQILCSSTYDGSVSYLVAKGQKRTCLGKIFTAICRANLFYPHRLLDLYEISENDDDDTTLQKICQIATDIGFYGAAVSSLLGATESTETRSHLMLFDLGNPFPGLLESGHFATHIWDIVSLLGSYDDLVPQCLKLGISEWRQSILNYCYTGDLSCGPWQRDSQTALLVQKTGIKCLDHTALTESRAHKLLEIAESECFERGCDMIWENVVRFFLKIGDPRYSQEVDEIMAVYG